MGISYDYVRKGETTACRAAACFSNMWRIDSIDTVVYRADYSSLEPELISKFINLVYSVFGDKRLSHKTRGKTVTWTLRANGLVFGKMLVYLGTLRVPDESPNTAKAWEELVEKGKIDKPAGLFAAFQEACAGGTFYNTNHNILVPEKNAYGYSPKWNGPITIIQLRKNLARKEKKTCFQHFIYP